MMPHSKKGFIIILVTVSLAVLILSASVIVAISCSELLATRVRNDLLVSAYYVAISGCERMYAHQKTLTSLSTPISGTILVGSNTIGTYSAIVHDAGSNEFYIVSTGIVNGHTATATVKLGYLTDYSGPLAVGAYGAVTLNGSSTEAKIKMEGPVASSTTTPTLLGRTDISGDPQTISNTGTPKVEFWLPDDLNNNIYPKTNRDTNADNNYLTDVYPPVSEEHPVAGDGKITIEDAEGDPAKIEIFNNDNSYPSSEGGDAEINEKDAFFYYYTTYLNNSANLNIGVGESSYYSGDQTFGTSSIPDSVPIIFVNGNCTITGNDGATTDHTVVMTGNLTLTQPDNENGDRNTYVVYGNVSTSGEMGYSGGTKGDLIIFANGDIDKQGGGKMNASFFANGTLNIDTAGDTGKSHLMLSRLTETWDEGGGPIGIPPGYPDEITTGFSIKNQTSYPPVWQRE